MSSLFVYFILSLDSIVGLLGAIVGVLSFITILTFVGKHVYLDMIQNQRTPDSIYKYTHDHFRKYLLAMIISIVLVVITPDTKKAVIIWAIPSIVNSEFIQEDLPKESKEMYDLLKQYIQKEINTSSNIQSQDAQGE